MPWQIIPNPWSGRIKSDHSGQRAQGLFIKKAKGRAAQIWLGRELAELLGDALIVFRDGYKFRLVATEPDHPASRLITGRGISYRPKKFTCRELWEALDDERVYVREVEQGVYEL